MILCCPWVVPSVKDWYIHCVRRSPITSFQQQLDCLIAIQTLCSMALFICCYFIMVGLVEYAVTSEFPQCGIKKVYQIKYPVLSYDFCSYSVIEKLLLGLLRCFSFLSVHFFRWSTVTRPVRSCTGLAIKRSVRCYRSRERNTKLSLHHDYRNRPKVFKRTALLWY